MDSSRKVLADKTETNCQSVFTTFVFFHTKGVLNGPHLSSMKAWESGSIIWLSIST